MLNQFVMMHSILVRGRTLRAAILPLVLFFMIFVLFIIRVLLLVVHDLVLRNLLKSDGS